MTDDVRADEVPSDGRPAEFGPGGYLPERAARRARKIVLRQPMGLAWPIAAAVVAVAVLALGLTNLLTQAGSPRAPFVAVGQLDATDQRGADVVALADQRILVVRGTGGIRAFSAPEGEVAYCRSSLRLEAQDGRVWTPDGRLVGGDGSSLAPHPVRVHDGVLYIDPSPGPALSPAAAGGGQGLACP